MFFICPLQSLMLARVNETSQLLYDNYYWRTQLNVISAYLVLEELTDVVHELLIVFLFGIATFQPSSVMLSSQKLVKFGLFINDLCLNWPQCLKYNSDICP